MILKVETEDGGPVRGWEFFWAKHVTGFDYTNHCAACLRGGWDRTIRKEMSPGEYPIQVKTAFFYICGVAEEGYFRNNLHMPVTPAKGETAEVVAWTGDKFTITDARLMPIPEIPQRWKGMHWHYTTCRNFQWAVATFGWPKGGSLFDGADLPPDPKSLAKPPKFRRGGNALFGTRNERRGFSRFAVGRVKGASNGPWHVIERSREGHLRCDCPSWRFQRAAANDRACRHTMAFRTAELGEESPEVEVFEVGEEGVILPTQQVAK